MAGVMRQLIYISTARGPQTVADIEQLLAKTRQRNRADNVTGLLLYNGIRFLQVLEGNHVVLTHTYERIHADARHRSVVVLSDRDIDAREFGDWSMAFERDADSARFVSLAEQVEAAVQSATPNTKALFESFSQAA